jgi:hypothetical protein
LSLSSAGGVGQFGIKDARENEKTPEFH